MQIRRSRRAHPFTLLVIAFLAAPTVAMLPAIALEGNAHYGKPSSGFFPIPMEHVDVVARPKAKSRRVVVRAHRAAPKAKRSRSTPALRVGFSWPVAKAAITSPFGWRPFVVTPEDTGPHPAREFHHGIDISCALNQPVSAAKGGVVVLSGMNPDYGNVIVIQHAGGWSTLYAHLNRRLINAGEHVSSGAGIGLCGMTGRAVGVHLHFEIRHLGAFFNPIDFLP